MDGQHTDGIQRFFSQGAFRLIRLLRYPGHHQVDEPGQGEMWAIGQCFGHLSDLPQIGHSLLAVERRRRQL